MRNNIATLEENLAVFYKAKQVLPCDTTIVFLGIYLTNLKTYKFISTQNTAGECL